MKKRILAILLAAVCACGIFAGTASAFASTGNGTQAVNGTVTCPNCGNDAHRRIIYRQIKECGDRQHFARFIYDIDCDYCGWTEETAEQGRYFNHTAPCGLCGHTGPDCTQCH